MGALGRFFRRIEDSLGLDRKDYHKVNRAKSGLTGKKQHSITGAPVVFDNKADKKPWQVGPNYEKPNLAPKAPQMSGNLFVFSDGSRYRKTFHGELVRA